MLTTQNPPTTQTTTTTFTLAPDALKAYRALVATLEKSLHADIKNDLDETARLKQSWQESRDKERTADSFAVWLNAYVTQVAVAWVLTTIFARYIEDNDLINDRLLAGNPDQIHRVEDAQRYYFNQHPTHSDTDYLLDVFQKLAEFPAGEVFHKDRNPLYQLRINGDAGRALLTFFQKVDPDTGLLVHPFKTTHGDTRFLGDLYQDLSEATRKRYALLQTPDFVEAFILEHTLLPAIETFGADTVRFIDPTCGSGHFLLGGFQTILDHKLALHPGTERATLVKQALDATHGVDLNPFAVHIARFRLTIAALFQLRDDGQPVTLHHAPKIQLRIAVGDSLIHGQQFPRFETKTDKLGAQGEIFDYRLTDAHSIEDDVLIFGHGQTPGILTQQYHAVVGNPPYITVSDKAVNETYRRHYDSCRGKYALVCPFYERFFDLAIGKAKQTLDEDLTDWKNRTTTAGFVGMIVANSFMKRSFGKTLIEELIPKTDLTHVIDTSGAYIPGHGTPTVILFGRNQLPQADNVRTILGIRGEPTTPENPPDGLVWRAIVDHIDIPGFENDFVSIDDTERTLFHEHPWTLQGGGALIAFQKIDNDNSRLNKTTSNIGMVAYTGEDEVYVNNNARFARLNIPIKDQLGYIEGEAVRDWSLHELTCINGIDEHPSLQFQTLQYLWAYRTNLQHRIFFGKTPTERGYSWQSFNVTMIDRFNSHYLISVPFVATHNHFVLDRGGKVFNRTAPVIKLPADATEDDHLGLLGLLNSSTIAFWGRMTFFQKGGSVEQWEDRLEWDGTKMKNVPIPEGRPLTISRQLDTLAQQLAALEPASIAAREIPTSKVLDAARDQSEKIHHQMIALQEELDWQCYGLYGLLDAPPLAENIMEIPPVRLGERAFEIVLARQIKAKTLKTAWFSRHGSKPITEIPKHWPEDYRALVQARIDAIATQRFIKLIEAPEFKRRWNTDDWKKREDAALKTWLLDRLETARYIPQAPQATTLTSDPEAVRDNTTPATLTTLEEITRTARQDTEFLTVASRYMGDPSFDVARLIHTLVLAESVPFLPTQRYKESGLRFRREWENTWELQRREDAGETDLDIPKPPNYTSKDFQSDTIYSLRGKLDVPRERFITYPGAEGEDGSPVVSWAGLNHQQTAHALATYYYEVQSQGWPKERLLPLLAGLKDLLPWVRQWHPEPHPDFGQPYADFLESILQEAVHQHGLTPSEIEQARIG